MMPQRRMPRFGQALCSKQPFYHRPCVGSVSTGSLFFEGQLAKSVGKLFFISPLTKINPELFFRPEVVKQMRRPQTSN